MILNLKCVFLCFQATFGLNINLNKSESVKLEDNGDENILATVLGCK